MIPTVEAKIDTNLMRSAMSYDPETGIITWCRSRTRAIAGQRAGSVRVPKQGVSYRVIHHQGSLVLEHRIAWFLAYGEWPDGIIDHINGDGCDNRLANLRVVTFSQNCHNAKMPRTNTSGELGIVYRPDRKKWRANITVNGKKHYLGLFATKEEAAQAYAVASLTMVGPINRSILPCIQLS